MATGLLSFQPVNQYSQGDVTNSQDAYNSSNTAYNQAQNNLQSYQQNMQDPSTMYSQNLTGAEGSLGFDPSQILNANKQLAVTQNQMANLPQSIASQGGGYGVTAGQMGNNYTQASGNLNSALSAQGNNLNALQSTYSNALNQAGQQTQFGVQGQQMQLGALQNISQNALTQMDQARQVMQNMEALYQSQGQFNSSQQAAYESANAAYTQAMAAAQLAQQQATQIQQENAIGAANSAYTMNPNSTGGFNYFDAGKPITVQQYNQALNQPTNQGAMLGQPGATSPSKIVTGTY